MQVKKARILGIKRIETVKEGQRLYNIAVEEDESYIIEGLVSHNCGCKRITVASEDEEAVQDGDLEFEGDVNV